MPTTPISSLRVPSATDSPNGPLQIGNLASDLDSLLNTRFATAAARDLAITAPVVGQPAVVAGEPMRYTSAGWRYVGALLVATMGSRPTQGLYSGLEVKPLDRPMISYTYDGTRFVQNGVTPSQATTGPAGSYVTKQEGSTVVAVNSAGNGSFTITLPMAFAATPIAVTMDVGDYGGGQAVSMVPLRASDTASTIVGFALLANNSAVPNGTNVRVNWTAVGYNT